ncbi:ribonucleotide-diphosphate reductase subunit beta [Leifsonia sp. NPDC102414]
MHGSTTTSTASTENVAGYEIPVDPMDDLQCDSCQ